MLTPEQFEEEMKRFWGGEERVEANYVGVKGWG